MSFIKLNMFALIDCNNFYASCERVFRPDLTHKPIIVLSNNDGCVIARSNESKALGIQMGIPYFQIHKLCKQHQVHVFSSNYTLYGDFSERVMSIIQTHWPQVEIYSIDEAFLDLSSLPPLLITSFCTELRRKILQYTGIPTSIGIGETKTLAKLANVIAKKKLAIPVFNLYHQKSWLKQIEVSEIWGIGRQWTKKLHQLKIFTAYDLAHYSISALKNQFNITLSKTALELKGTPCLSLEEWQPKKAIVSSCSFGEMQTTLQALKEAISYHCATAWGKMRKQNSRAGYLSVFIYTNPFRKDLSQQMHSIGFKLIHPSDDIRILTHHSLHCLQHIFKEGFHYKKCGVLLTDFSDKNHSQLDLFNSNHSTHQDQGQHMMTVLQQINHKFGSRTIHLAAEGVKKQWSMKRKIQSPSYTTRWTEIPTVYARHVEHCETSQ